jgi:hypothetical protein
VFVISSREGSKVLVVWRGGDRVAVSWKWLSMLLVVGVGGFCPLRAVKGADGAELLGEMRKVLTFLETTVGSLPYAVSSLVGKKSWKQGEPGLGMALAIIDGNRFMGDEGGVLSVEVLRTKARSSGMVWLGESFGKEHCVIDIVG